MSKSELLRADLACIAPWISPESRVLDLGCGQGQLLAHLEAKSVKGIGLEIDPDNIEKCLAKGISVIEQNLDEGLGNFADNTFDVVVMTQALQALQEPDKILKEMLRIGREAIVTFPNFGHWRCRAYLSSKGMMPVSEFMPYKWYNTPNIHFCTFSDFEKLCDTLSLRIIKRHAVDQTTHQPHALAQVWPNLFGEVAIYHLTR